MVDSESGILAWLGVEPQLQFRKVGWFGLGSWSTPIIQPLQWQEPATAPRDSACTKSDATEEAESAPTFAVAASALMQRPQPPTPTQPKVKPIRVKPIPDAAAPSAMTRAAYSQILHMSENAQQAAQARVDKETRRRMREEQQQKMRNRALELRQRQRSDNRQMEAVRRAAAKKAPSSTIITLSNMTSEQRAYVAKVLWSPVLCGDNDRFAAPQEYHGC